MNSDNHFTCRHCAITFARHDDGVAHQTAVHKTTPEPSILAAIERLRNEDRDLLEKLSDT